MLKYKMYKKPRMSSKNDSKPLDQRMKEKHLKNHLSMQTLQTSIDFLQMPSLV